MCFVDLEKAFDGLSWKVLELALRRRKYQKFCEISDEGAKTRVREDSVLSEVFDVKVRIHEGSVLSPFFLQWW